MRKYEGIFIFHPQTDETVLKKKLEEVGKYITSQKGKVEKIKEPLREKLPYPIKKCREGLYVVIDFEVSPEAVDELKKKFLKDESFLRYTIIKK